MCPARLHTISHRFTESLRPEKIPGDHRTPAPAESKVTPNPVAWGFIQLGVGKFASIEIPRFERRAWSYLYGFLEGNTVLSFECIERERQG